MDALWWLTGAILEESGHDRAREGTTAIPVLSHSRVRNSGECLLSGWRDIAHEHGFPNNEDPDVPIRVTTQHLLRYGGPP